MVRSNTFEIRWHDTQPIFSCSFQSVNPASLRKTLDLNNLHATAANQLSNSSHDQDSASTSNATLLAASSQPWKFATAGADKHVRVWMVYPNIPSPAALAKAAANATALPPRVEFLSTLTKHTNAVNAVKFSPDGERIGTAGDDGMLMVWSQTTHHNLQHNAFTDEEASYSKETWKAGHTMKITPSELYDLAWSPNGEAIAAGGTDFVVRIIDVASSSVIREILEHSLHVQGVAWDPLNEFLATQSADRSVHIFNLNTKITPTGTHSGLPGTPTTVSKNTRMELHKRSGSFGGVGGKDHSGSSSSSNNNAALAGPSNLSKSNLDISNSNAGGNTGSSSSSSGGGGNFIWDPQARPPMQRRGSSVSHASESGGERDSSFPPGRSGRSSTPSSVIGGNSNNPTNPQFTTAIHNSSFGASGSNNNNRPATPTPSIPQSPFSTTSAIGGGGIPHAMNPPQRTPSRRSSFSGSNAEIDPLGSPPTSTSSMVRLASAGAPGGIPTSSSTNELINNNATASGSSDLRHGRSSSASTQGGGGNGGGGNLARSVRSPSPMPPLPAIRAPPSPKQRLKAAQAQLGMGHGKGMLARVQLYGDEHFTGFFRRLNFSPDGALLVTPAGIFDNNVKDSHGNNIVSPSSPTFSKDQLPLTSSSSAASPVPTSTTTNSNNKNQNSNSNATRSTVYLYGRGNFNRSNSPIAHLPGHKTASIVVKFNPILYELRFNPNGDEGNKPHQTVPLEVGREKSVNIAPPATSTSNAREDDSSSKKDGKRARHDSSGDSDSSKKKSDDSESKPRSMIGLPYRMVFAVATYDSVWIYDTQQTGPLCCFSNMHYAAFTDLAWSPDGQTLMMSSTDGYCSIAVFDYNELGTPYQYSSQPSLKAPIGGNPTNILHAHGGSSAPSSSSSSSSVNNNTPTSAQQQQPHSTLSQSPLGLGLTTGNPSTSTSTATTLTSTDPKDATTNQDSSSSDQPKKRRRIQPTVQPK